MKEPNTKKKYRHYTYFQDANTLAQFACFHCRKIYKRKVPYDWTIPPEKSCPQCQAVVWFTGTAFKAPRQEDIKQWQKAELLIKNGVLFHPNYGYRPKVLREVAPFLKRAKLKTAGERLLARLAKTKT